MNRDEDTPTICNFYRFLIIYLVLAHQSNGSNDFLLNIKWCLSMLSFPLTKHFLILTSLKPPNMPQIVLEKMYNVFFCVFFKLKRGKVSLKSPIYATIKPVHRLNIFKQKVHTENIYWYVWEHCLYPIWYSYELLPAFENT